jgi:hypothetical protein
LIILDSKKIALVLVTDKPSGIVVSSVEARPSIGMHRKLTFPQ